MPCPGSTCRSGSSACFTATCRSMTRDPSSSRAPGSFSSPTPCSPVTVPPSSRQSSTIRSNASFALAFAASSPSGAMISGCRLPSPAWAMLRDHDVVLGRGRLDAREHLGHRTARHADVLGEHRAEALERRVREPAREEQPVDLGGIDRLLHRHRTGIRHDAGHGCRALGADRTDLVHLREQHRVDAVRQAEPLPCVDRLDAGAVDELERRRHDPAAVISATATPAARSLPNEPTAARSSRPRAGAGAASPR